jgi:hypothetical protein
MGCRHVPFGTAEIPSSDDREKTFFDSPPAFPIESRVLLSEGILKALGKDKKKEGDTIHLSCSKGWGCLSSTEGFRVGGENDRGLTGMRKRIQNIREQIRERLRSSDLNERGSVRRGRPD